MASSDGAFPNFFNTMGESMPALIGEIPNPTHDLNVSLNRVSAALRDISFVYRNKSRTVVRNNWRDPAARCAYVFLYFVKHSHLVYEALCENRRYFDSPLWTWRRLREIKVCSLGGGPGSDIAGVIAFLDKINCDQALSCSVLDFFPEWQFTWNDIRTKLPPTKLQYIGVQYRKFDMIKEPPFSLDLFHILRTADLLTFVKSFSNVCQAPSAHLTVLPHIMEVLKPGAFVLFIDNTANRNANESFKRIAQDAGLYVLHQFVHNMCLPVPASDLVGGFGRVFDYKPLRTCCVTIYLFQKPRPQPIHFSQQCQYPYKTRHPFAAFQPMHWF